MCHHNCEKQHVMLCTRSVWLQVATAVLTVQTRGLVIGSVKKFCFSSMYTHYVCAHSEETLDSVDTATLHG